LDYLNKFVDLIKKISAIKAWKYSNPGFIADHYIFEIKD